MAPQTFSWIGRRVFVTGATGIVGSWLVKRLLDRGAHVVALVRDWDPQTELVRSGDILRTNVVNGRLEDYDTLERAINEHEIDTVFHLGAQPIVSRRRCGIRCRRSRRTSAAPTTCWRPAAFTARSSARRRGQQRQGLR